MYELKERLFNSFEVGEAESDELQGVVPQNEVIPIGKGEALKRLLQVASVPWDDPARADQALETLDRLVGGTPAYRFCFQRDPSVNESLLQWLQSFVG